MTRQISLDVPEAVYEQMEQLAAAERRSFAEVLVDTITQPASNLYVDPNRSAMLREKTAFLAMHPHLLELYQGHYVAIFRNQLIDHDQDVLALARRINRDYPSDVVLIKQVIDQPDKVLNFRSPRLVRVK